jgi:hypothetical protein
MAAAEPLPPAVALDGPPSVTAVPLVRAILTTFAFV